MIPGTRWFATVSAAGFTVAAMWGIGPGRSVAQDAGEPKVSLRAAPKDALQALQKVAQADAPPALLAVSGSRTVNRIFSSALQDGLRDLQATSPAVRGALTRSGDDLPSLSRSLDEGTLDAAVRRGLKRWTGLRPPTEGLKANATRSGGEQKALLQATRRTRGADEPDETQPSGDWRKAKVIMAIDGKLENGSPRPDVDERNQGMSFNAGSGKYDQENACGCCWAFGTAGAYEHAYAIRFRKYVNIAEEELLSFADPANYSCNGGWWAFDYMLTNRVPSETLNRYVGRQITSKASAPRFTVEKWGYVTTDREVPGIPAIKAALCEYGPLAIAVNATPRFSNYSGGIFQENDPGNVNHAILLVGWHDASGSDPGYWIIRNSWGSDWGEGGFMRISYTTNRVGFGAAWVIPAQAP